MNALVVALALCTSPATAAEVYDVALTAEHLMERAIARWVAQQQRADDLERLFTVSQRTLQAERQRHLATRAQLLEANQDALEHQAYGDRLEGRIDAMAWVVVAAAVVGAAGGAVVTYGVIRGF